MSQQEVLEANYKTCGSNHDLFVEPPDRESAPHPARESEWPRLGATLEASNFVEKVFSDIYKANKKVDGVIHFAGVKSVFESKKNPFLYWNINVL